MRSRSPRSCRSLAPGTLRPTCHEAGSPPRLGLLFLSTISHKTVSQSAHQSTRALKIVQTSAIANPVKIRCPYLDSGVRSRKSGLRVQMTSKMGTSLSKDAYVTKFTWRSIRFFLRYEPSYWKMPYLAMLKNLSKTLGSGFRCITWYWPNGGDARWLGR